MPERLFGEDVRPLARRIAAIANLPEIQLGRDTDYTFSAEQMASILRDWVNGVSLSTMAQQYSTVETDPDVRIMNFSRYLFSKLLSRVAWGIGALETVCLSGSSVHNVYEGPGTTSYLPSMIFFGVKQQAAIWLRMVGVPRIVADKMALLWQQSNKGAPTSYEAIRYWVAELTDSDWLHVIPTASALTPRDMRLIWQDFAG